MPGQGVLKWLMALALYLDRDFLLWVAFQIWGGGGFSSGVLHVMANTWGIVCPHPTPSLADHCSCFIPTAKTRSGSIARYSWADFQCTALCISCPVQVRSPMAPCASVAAAAPPVPVHRHGKGFRTSRVFQTPVSPSHSEIQDLA